MSFKSRTISMFIFIALFNLVAWGAFFLHC
jgi:CHASE3 domain sensor protein